MKRKYKKLILNLSWNCSTEVQEKSINQLIADESIDYKILLQPETKDCWYNCAKILIEIGYPRNKDTICGLFEWLQDMNWPGALEIRNYLESLPKKIFMPYYEDAIKRALKDKDEIWLYFLTWFINSLSLKEDDFTERYLFDAMNKEY